ncbi:hypothetical protein D3Z58_08595 [Clostridiaceae bacterium]|nr:hypothetical protein [Clostridiaceae bacterium]
MKTTLKKRRQYKIDSEKIFETKLEILQSIENICIDNQLTYFAFGKLLIGCVHYGKELPEEHQPWDIGLLRPDYEKLVNILKNPNEDYGIYLDQYYKNTNYPSPLYRIGKVCEINIGAFFIEEPCWIFISPFDNVPEDFDYFCGYIRKMRRKNQYYAWILKVFTSKNFQMKLLKCIWKKIDQPQKAFARREQTAKMFSDTSNCKVGRIIFKKSEILALTQLLPVQNLSFGNIFLPCPSDYSCWTAPMSLSLKKQTLEIQKVVLYVLKEFDRVCRLLNLGYFICGGTLLGCIRHQGFIPWDDDIDVGMIREDYERFLEEANKYLDSHFFLQTRQSDPEIPYLFSKIRVNNTEYITQYNENRNFHKGICLDIFPFDVLPPVKKKCDKFLKRAKRLIRRHNLVCNKQLPEPSIKFPETTLEEKWWHFIGKAQRKLFKQIPLKFTQHSYIKHVTRYNYLLHQLDNCEVASFVPTYTHIKIKDLLPYREMTFEHLTVKVPYCPDVFLSMQYHDYMQLPPVHRQEGHELIRYSAQIEIDL